MQQIPVIDSVIMTEDSISNPVPPLRRNASLNHEWNSNCDHPRIVPATMATSARIGSERLYTGKKNNQPIHTLINPIMCQPLMERG